MLDEPLRTYGFEGSELVSEVIHGVADLLNAYYDEVVDGVRLFSDPRSRGEPFSALGRLSTWLLLQTTRPLAKAWEDGQKRTVQLSPKLEAMASVCEQCGGSGQLFIQEADRRFVRPCPCVAARKLKRAIEAARITERYQNCSLDDYRIDFPSATRSLAVARHYAMGFVECYPVETGTTGLMFMGSIGVGKTHLAVAILKALILDRGASGLFCDYREFLKQLQQTYSQRGDGSERELLDPVPNTPVPRTGRAGSDEAH